MKRLVAIGLSLLMLVGFPADAVAMSDSDKQKYLAWVKEDRSKAAALALDSAGCWATSRGFGTGQAKSYALQRCASKCASRTCKIVDVNGKSKFIKQMLEAEGKRRASEIEAQLKKEKEEKKAAEVERKRLEEEKKKRKEAEKRKAAETERKRLEEEKKKRVDAEKKVVYILDNLQTVPLEEIEQFLSDYQSVLEPSSGKAVLNEYFVRSRDKAIADSDNIFRALSDVFSRAKKIGIDLTGIKDTGVHVVEIVRAGKEDEHDFSVNLIDQNLPIYLRPVRVTSLQEIGSGKTKNFDYLIILHNGNATSTRVITEHETVESEYEYSTRRIPNDEYYRVQREVDQWRRLYNAEKIPSVCYKMSYSRARQCKETVQGNRRFFWNELDKAQKKLDQTPSTILEPIYQTYSFNKSTVHIKKNVWVNVYVVDKKMTRSSWLLILLRMSMSIL